MFISKHSTVILHSLLLDIWPIWDFLIFLYNFHEYMNTYTLKQPKTYYQKHTADWFLSSSNLINASPMHDWYSQKLLQEHSTPCIEQYISISISHNLVRLDWNWKAVKNSSVSHTHKFYVHLGAKFWLGARHLPWDCLLAWSGFWKPQIDNTVYQHDSI